MDVLPLLSIPTIYFLIAFTKPYFQPKLPFNICAICVAVSVSWLIMLVMWLFGENVSVVSLGILMGMSITGVMYKAEAFYKKKAIRNFWLVRLLIVVGGFLGIYKLLHKEWNALTLIAIVTLLLITISSLLFQKITHNDVVNEQEKSGKDKSLIKRLDDCC